MRNETLLDRMDMQDAECCPVGTYRHCVLMPIAGRVRGIDHCISDIVAALNTTQTTETAASCCGHGKMVGTVLLEDGRWLLVCDEEKARTAMKVLEGEGYEDRMSEIIDRQERALQIALEALADVRLACTRGALAESVVKRCEAAMKEIQDG